MKILVIHPNDPTIEFLSAMYADLNYKTIIKKGVSKSERSCLIKSHDRILFLGHDTTFGLLNTGHFHNSGLFIIDDLMAIPLKYKSNCLNVWYYADQFVKRNGLSGLCTGMFSSESGEAECWGFEDIDHAIIDQTLRLFLVRGLSEGHVIQVAC